MTEEVNVATEVAQGAGTVVDRATDHMQEPTWYLSEGVPGVGERPEFLDPKFKSVADMAKSYKELQKTLSSTSGAPEQYDFGEYKEVINPENPHIKDYLDFAKKNRLSQDVINESLKAFIGYQNSLAPDINKEIEKLGPNGGERIETVKRWAENNLSEKSLETLGKISTNAEVIEFLDELRQFQYHSTTQPPIGNNVDQSAFKPLTVGEVQAEMEANYSRYLNDANYRAQIAQKFEQAVG